VDETIGASSLEALRPDPVPEPDADTAPVDEDEPFPTEMDELTLEPDDVAAPSTPPPVPDERREPEPTPESAAPDQAASPEPPVPIEEAPPPPEIQSQEPAPAPEKPDPAPRPTEEVETMVIKGKPAVFTSPDDLPLDVNLSGDAAPENTAPAGVDETIGASSLEALQPAPVEKPRNEAEPAGKKTEPEQPAPDKSAAAAPAAPGPASKPAPAQSTRTPAPATTAAAVKAAPAPAAKPKPAAKTPERDDAGLDESSLDDTGLRIKRAFDDKRVIQMFQPIIALTADEESEEEIYQVSIQVIDSNGMIVNPEEVRKCISVPAFQKFVDRWMLRETFGRVVNSESGANTFLLKLSHASLADPGLFNWLRKMLTQLAARDPGKSIFLEFSSNGLAKLQKPADALMSYLRKSHGFRFSLSEISTVADALAALDRSRFDLLRLSCDQVRELQAVPAPPGDDSTAIQRLAKNGTDIITDGITDATTLTDAISLGVTFAMGDFIGEATAQLDDTTSVESFEIT